MSLWPIKTVTNIFPYTLFDGRTLDPIWDNYNLYLLEPPRLYEECLDSIRHFFYEPSNDRLVSYVTFTQIHWPGWTVYRYEWDAETGNFIGRTVSSIWCVAWHSNAGIGSYNKLFDINVYGNPEEVAWNTLGWTSPMWKRTDLTLWHAVVNLQDNLVAGVLNWNLDVYDISQTPPVIKASMRLPNTLGYLCMENREICWVITQDGLILKANYKNPSPRWEMLSSVQDPSLDAINYFITWDPKRSRLVVLRQRPDAADGSCQCQLEFYRPLVKVAGITDPVPVGRHRAGDITEFVAHIYGDSGEGICPYRVTASLQSPANGSLLQAESISTQNGQVSFLYQAPDIPGSDTLIIDTTITDGET